MSSSVLRQAELSKLAGTLGVSDQRLEYLGRLDVSEIRDLRAAVIDKVASDSRVVFQRLAAASRVLPNSVAARLGRYLGADVVARLTAELTPKRAAALADKMPVEFLADVCVYLDPAAVPPLLEYLPSARVTQTALELYGRRDLVTMARLTEPVPDEIVERLLNEIDDPALLTIGLLMESAERRDRLVWLLPEERLSGILQSAVAQPDLWPDALTVVASLLEPLRERLATIFERDIASNPEQLDDLLRQVERMDLWPALLRLASAASQNLRRVAVERALAVGDPTLSILATASDHGLSRELLVVLTDQSDQTLDEVARRVSTVPTAVWEPAATAAKDNGGEQIIERIGALRGRPHG